MLNTKPIVKNKNNSYNYSENINSANSHSSKHSSRYNSHNNISVKHESYSKIHDEQKSQTSEKYNFAQINYNKNPINNENINNENPSNILLVNNTNNNIDNNINNMYNNEQMHRIEWNEEQNSYIIYENNQLDCTITHNDILKYIISPNTGKTSIKKYIFIISTNTVHNVNEFNFINSIFTSNLDYMLKLQNYIYDSINNYENLNIIDVENFQEILLLFYYQLIIWLFKNISIFENNQDNFKIAKLYSCFSYRFSSLVLKLLLKIQNSCTENNEIFEKLMLLKNDISIQLLNINEYLDKNNEDSTVEFTLSTKSSSNKINYFNNPDDNNDNIFNSQIEEIEEIEEIDDNNSKKYTDGSIIVINESESSNKDVTVSLKNILHDYNIKNKDGFPINNLHDLFSDKINTSDNGYMEVSDNLINDTISSYKNSNKSNKSFVTVSNTQPNVSNNTNIENSGTGTLSYNPASALDNGKVYKLELF
jgi:hypothetical protein